MVRNQLRLKRHIPRSLHPRLCKLNIVIPQQFHHYQLNLVPREKPARTCVAAVAEGHAFEIAGGPLAVTFYHGVGGAGVGF